MLFAFPMHIDSSLQVQLMWLQNRKSTGYQIPDTYRIPDIRLDIRLIRISGTALKRKVDFSDFHHVDIFAYERFKLASGEPFENYNHRKIFTESFHRNYNIRIER